MAETRRIITLALTPDECESHLDLDDAICVFDPEDRFRPDFRFAVRGLRLHGFRQCADGAWRIDSISNAMYFDDWTLLHYRGVTFVSLFAAPYKPTWDRIASFPENNFSRLEAECGSSTEGQRFGFNIRCEFPFADVEVSLCAAECILAFDARRLISESDRPNSTSSAAAHLVDGLVRHLG